MEAERSSRSVFVARLVVGLAQGLALYLLYSAYEHKVWPATNPDLFAPLVMVALYVPLLVLQGLGNLRAATLLIWTGAATVLLAGLSFYDVWRAWPGALMTPSAASYFVCAVFLFVAHALVSCGDADRKIVANYPTLFDLAWKLGVQIAIAACFVLSFWLMIWLGVALFDMIKLTGFQKLIEHPWVWIPLTTLATAVSIHVTDTRANLVRGVRTLALTLLGWLLPVIAAIAFAFLVSLMITGLQPLWETRSATFLLMAAAAVLVIHINAVYQDGNPDQRPHHILRVAGTLASVLLVFIVAIAGYALSLRVGQYGWTADRITSAACVLIAAMFAVGYLVAAILPGLWLKLIERWNVYGTFLFLIVVFALSTPIADPARLSVNDQMARLKSGVVKAEKFDFNYLRWNGGRFGKNALAELAQSPDKYVRDAVALAEKEWVPYDRPAKPGVKTSIRDLVRVFPIGKALPSSFLNEDWGTVYAGEPAPNCLNNGDGFDSHCTVLFSDLDGDGNDEAIIFLPSDIVEDQWWIAELLKFDGHHWRRTADIGSQQHCKGDRAAILAGKFKPVPATDVPPDLEVNGHRVFTNRSFAKPDCK